MNRQKATSVTEEGEPKGYVPEPGYFDQLMPSGETRLVVSVPAADLARVHRGLVDVMEGPMGFMYRQHIDRVSPREEGAPPVDHVALEQPKALIMSALVRFDGLMYEDARGEFWVRGEANDSIVLDTDGLIFCYPDDVAFHDALARLDVPHSSVQTVRDEDYVKHWFFADNDSQETGLINALGLAKIGSR